jgi:plastocyanin
MLKRIAFGSALVAVLALLVVSCGGKKEGGNENIPTGTGEKAPYQSAGDEGTITGKIAFTGTAPTPKTLDFSADPVCVSAATNKTTDDVVVKDGKLANVFIYIKSGGAVDKYAFAIPADEPQIDQKGCRYAPHVLGVMAKQNIKIVNSDNTTHNIHFTPSKNEDWNQSEPPGAPPKEKSFSRSEILIPVKCNVHPWMKAYVGVMPHPFFSVSGEDGSYTIKNVPPGEYTIVAWHEKYGEQTQKVTVGAKESKTQDFTFSATSAYAPTSLKVEPALVLN